MEERDEILDVRPWLRASAWIVGGMLAASAAAWLALPEGARLAVHWGIDGRPDRFASKAMALLAVPLSALLSVAIFAVAPFLDPRRGNLARSRALYQRVWIGSLLVLGVAHGAILAAGLGLAVPVERIVTPAVALLIAAIGDVMSKSRSNFVAGIRTPWTLSSDLVWEKTHRWTGRLLVAAGLGAVLASLLGPPGAGMGVLLIGTFGAFLAGIGLSYLFWRRDPGRRASS